MAVFLAWNTVSAAQATPFELPPLQPGQVLRIGPAAGTGTPTVDYGIGATDLCEFMQFPEQLLQVCGMQLEEHALVVLRLPLHDWGSLRECCLEAFPGRDIRRP